MHDPIPTQAPRPECSWAGRTHVYWRGPNGKVICKFCGKRKAMKRLR